MTVLFIGAVMTATISTAAFVAVEEFRAAGDDRGASSALAYAEAGVDRTALWLRSNKAVWSGIVLSGCGAVGTVGGVSYPTITLQGQVNAGHYSATVTRADACSPLPTGVPDPKVPQSMFITSTGCNDGTAGQTCPTAAARRVVRQVVSLTARPLPVGVSGNRIDMRGSPNFVNMTIFAKGIVNTRKQINVTGIDPYYEKEQFYPCTGGLAVPACFAADADSIGDMPAAVHTTDRIFINPNGSNMHPPNPNCTSSNNDEAPGSHRYVWDGSGTGGITPTPRPAGCPAYPNSPPTTLFTVAEYNRLAGEKRLSEEDHNFFKEVAKQSGLYCSNYGSGSASCTALGAARTVTGNIDTSDVTGLGSNYVVYIEYPTGTNPLSNNLGWNVTNPVPQTPCGSTAPVSSSIILIVRNGGVDTKTDFLGAIFAEDGNFDTSGNLKFEGSMAVNILRARGNPTICMSTRWVNALPGAFINVTQGRWSEVDR